MRQENNLLEFLFTTVEVNFQSVFVCLLPSCGMSISKPLLNSGVFSQYAVSCSSSEVGAPCSIPPRQRPTSRATVLSRSTSHTQESVSCGNDIPEPVSAKSDVPVNKKNICLRSLWWTQFLQNGCINQSRHDYIFIEFKL